MEKVHAFQETLFYNCLVLITHYQFYSALMNKNPRSVHSDMEVNEKPVQTPKKKRTQSDKIGRLKYNQQLLKQTLSEIEEVKLMLRTIFAGLKGSFNFEQSLIERIVCIDEVDREILQLLYEAGNPGLLPNALQARLQRFKVTRHQVSRRILRMNKRLEKEFGERIAEKRGWHWALTRFAFESWNETQKQKDT
jgi:hypothetical protein